MPSPTPSKQNFHNPPPIRCALLGLGTVGSSVAQLLSSQPHINITQAVAKNLTKKRDLGRFSPVLSDDPITIASDPHIDVVIECLGGIEPSVSVIRAALTSGKHVVTANKDVMATYGHELRELATQHNVYLKYEAAVCAGIPLISPLQQSLGANQVKALMGILNGTCNYILSRMSQDNWDYETALHKAQELGFAEADPTNDVSGLDAAYKLAILSYEAFGFNIAPQDIPREGIDQLNVKDIQLAQSMGYTVKLLGIAEHNQQQNSQEQLNVRIHPALVPNTHPLASIHDEYNALWLQGDAVDDLMFYGKGAGGDPTASGVCGDLLSILPLIQSNQPSQQLSSPNKHEAPLTLQPTESTISKWYLRFKAPDTPGVVGHIGSAFGHSGVSIESIIQQGTHPDGTASIVVVTQPQTEGALQDALHSVTHNTVPDTPSAGKTQLACKLRILS